MSRDRAVPGNGEAQDVGRARDPAPRRRHDLDQRPDHRGVLPRVAHRDAWRSRRSRSRAPRARTTSACACTAAARPARPALFVTASPARSSRPIPNLRVAQARGLPDARRPRCRAQEGRAAQGAQGAAVLEALTSRLAAVLRHRRRPGRRRRGFDRRARRAPRPGVDPLVRAAAGSSSAATHAPRGPSWRRRSPGVVVGRRERGAGGRAADSRRCAACPTSAP